MANKYKTLNALFTAIADAIRLKKETTGKIVADNFPAEIRALETGFDYINSNITAIPDYCFYGCKEITTLDCLNITSIGVSAFENCSSLKTVFLYKDVTSIDSNAFKGCNNLTEIYVGWGEGEVDGAPWGATKATVYYLSAGSKNLEYILENDSYKVSLGTCLETNIIIPAYYKGVPVTSIKEVKVKTDYYNRFGLMQSEDYYYLVEKVTIPFGITKLSDKSFFGCWNLATIDIPTSVTDIEGKPFVNTHLRTINYSGTMEQWNQIRKSENWIPKFDYENDVGAYNGDIIPNVYVYCTDGSIKVS